MTAPRHDDDRPRGIWTNGIGNKTASHLNFTRSLADKPKTSKRSPRWKPAAGQRRYAGYDETEKGWR